jgi:acylphosphatase
MSADLARVRAVVLGVVQGVGFRYFVLRAARDARLTGFVKNLRNGSVEVVSEGPREKLESLVRELEQGPRRGLVRDVDVTWSEPTGEFRDFDVWF